MKKICVLFCMLFFEQVAGLTVSEIFHNGDDWIQSDERFLELYNDGNQAVDLLSLTLEVPVGVDKVATVQPKLDGNFVFEGDCPVTNESLLLPGACAVLTTAEQASGARLIAFRSNALVLGVSSKSRFSGSWSAGRLSLLRILQTNHILYDASHFKFPETDPKAGTSLHLIGNTYVIAPLSAGWESSGSLSVSCRLVKQNESVEIFYSNATLAQSSVKVRVKNCTSGNEDIFNMPSFATGQYGTIHNFSRQNHGDTLQLSCRGEIVLLRWQENFPLCSNFQDVVINEVIPEAVKDYSSSWDGTIGNGKITDTDEWIELANRSLNRWNLSNCYILQQTKSSISLKTLNLRWGVNPINPGTYAIASPSDGISKNARLILYQGHPYRNGRVMDVVEYGFDDIAGDGLWNNAPGVEDPNESNEALIRLPNACAGTNFKQLFMRGAASFAVMNGRDIPRLWVEQKENQIYVFLTDFDQTNTTTTVFVNGVLDMKTIILSNRGVFYKGKLNVMFDIPILENETIEVQNGKSLHFVYTNSYTLKVAQTDCIWKEAGWNVSEVAGNLDKVKVFPNPIQKGSDIYFANLPGDAVVRVVNKHGIILAELSQAQNGSLQWNMPLSINSGILTVVIQQGVNFCIKKILVR